LFYSIGEKFGKVGSFGSSSENVGFSPEDVGLNPSEYRNNTSLLWWELVVRSKQRFLSFLVLQGRVTQEQMDNEITRYVAMRDHVAKTATEATPNGQS